MFIRVMEAIIIGALALVGYEISKNPKTSRRKTENVTLLKDKNAYPSENEAIQPHNNMTPFFTSAKSQNTNDDVKQRRIETFTGCDDISFQSKKECSNMFTPVANLGHVNGTPGILNDYREDRFSLSVTDKMHNTLPFEQKQIGPGINASLDTAAKGGFHEMHRILPNNVGDYKKNNFAGRVQYGKNVTTKPDNAPNIQDNNKPQRYYTSDNRGTIQSKFQVSGSVLRPQIELDDTARGYANDLPSIGIAAPANHAESQQQRINSTRTYDSTQCIQYGNPSMASNGAGGYQTSTYIVSDGQRENPSNVLNTNQQSKGHLNYSGEYVNPTHRQNTNYEYNGNPNQQNAASASRLYQVNTTQRQTTNTEYTGAPNQQNTASGTRLYQANPTQRQSTHSSYVGVMGGSIKANSSDYSIKQNSCPYYLREQQSISYTPGGGNMNLQDDPNKMIPHMLVNNDCNINNHISHINGPKAVKDQNTMGRTEHCLKARIDNPNTHYLNLAQEQLCQNELAQNINNVQK